MKKAGEGLNGGQVALMAVCTGLIVANIYYCQPLVVLISKEFGVPEARAGIITFLTQFGYALGLLFIVPLGDKFERKKQILLTTALAVVALVSAALSPSLLALEVASVCIGFTSVVPQLILPLAAHLSDPDKRGKIIGSIMSGLLIGILLSRTISGYIGVWFGWRAMFWIAAGISGGLLFLIYLTFPRSKPYYSGTYSSLMKSLLVLLQEQPLLREASAINAIAFATFGMFWTTMVLHLSGSPFFFNSGIIGLFGIAAATGALIAPLVGKLADKGSPRKAVGFGIVLCLLGYATFYLAGYAVAGMILGIILLDLGMQGVHVSNQTRVYTLVPEARNRLNTVFMTLSFVGTSCGSAVGLWMWNLGNWSGVCYAGFALLVIALLIHRFSRPAVVLQS